jgi:hypothetical protein
MNRQVGGQMNRQSPESGLRRRSWIETRNPSCFASEIGGKPGKPYFTLLSRKGAVSIIHHKSHERKTTGFTII